MRCLLRKGVRHISCRLMTQMSFPINPSNGKRLGQPASIELTGLFSTHPKIEAGDFPFRGYPFCVYCGCLDNWLVRHGGVAVCGIGQRRGLVGDVAPKSVVIVCWTHVHRLCKEYMLGSRGWLLPSPDHGASVTSSSCCKKYIINGTKCHTLREMSHRPESWIHTPGTMLVR